ncbi:hypothetical protein [Kitasatospora sp. NPDC088346]|uniref:hypothetical protein n=1 Tax=Kitasatospora sp. NPDC088346 TaxID=3364073 RepID=UPI0037FAEC43
MTRTVQAYACLQPSAPTARPGGPALAPATSGGRTPVGGVANPRFLDGFLTAPAARHHQPLLRASLDPVVTADGERLRFESCSGCCGVHARLDVLAGGPDGAPVGHGTTDVDVTDPPHLAVGPGALEVTTSEGGVLTALASVDAARDADLIAVLLAREPRTAVADPADQPGLTPDRVRAAPTVLGTAGQIGYDADRAEARNPRLRAARDLVAAGAVRPAADGTVTRVTVDDHVHRVRTAADGSLGRTSLWWAKYRGGRGPCSHAPAVRPAGPGATGAGR